MDLKFVVKFLTTVFSVFYPFGIIFFSEFNLVLLIVMSILWGLRGILEINKNSDVKLSEFSKFSFVLCGFFALCAVLQNLDLKYLYPVLINVFLAVVFYMSLAKIPMITKFAMMKEPNLNQKARDYTRNLTKIWIYFFVLNAFVSAILAYLEDKFYWAIYCGVISYVLIGILLFGEIIFRKIYIKND